MKQLTEEQLLGNWEKMLQLVEDTFAGERKEKLLEMYKFFEDRMIVAPASGKETRENLKSSASDLKDDLDKKFHDLSQKIKDLDHDFVSAFKGKFENVKGDVKKKYDELTKKMKDFEDEVKEEMNELKKEEKDFSAAEA